MDWKLPTYRVAKRYFKVGFYQRSGRNPELRSPQTQRFLFLLQSPQLHRPLDVATVPLKDGAQPLQQNHAGGASHGATKHSPPPCREKNYLTVGA